MKIKFRYIILLLLLFILLVLGICFITYKRNTVDNNVSMCNKYDYYIEAKVNKEKLNLRNIVFCNNKKLYKYDKLKLTLYLKKDNSIEEIDYYESDKMMELGTFISNLELNKKTHDLKNLYVELNLVGMDGNVEILEVPIVEVENE